MFRQGGALLLFPYLPKYFCFLFFSFPVATGLKLFVFLMLLLDESIVNRVPSMKKGL